MHRRGFALGGRFVHKRQGSLCIRRALCVRGALGLVGTVLKWVERPRALLRGRAFLRLGLCQWSMSEVGAQDQVWFGEGSFMHEGLILFSVAPPLPPPPSQGRFLTSLPLFPAYISSLSSKYAAPKCWHDCRCADVAAHSLPWSLPFNPSSLGSLPPIFSTWLPARLLMR